MEESQSVVIAAVDIGTNTLKFSVARCFAGGNISVLAESAETVRIGAGIETTGRIDGERGQRAIDTLKRFQALGESHKSVAYVGVATETLRVATNGPQLLARITAETSWQVKTISGTEEARLTFVGLRDRIPAIGRVTIVDIGGGSTEWILAEDRAMSWSKSIAVGSGRLADRYFTSDPPGQSALQQSQEYAAGHFTTAVNYDYQKGDYLRLPGGNGQYIEQLRSRLHLADQLDQEVVARVLDILGRTPAREVANLLGIPLERARVLPAGVAVAAAAIDVINPKDISAVPSGIRTGLLTETADSYFAE